METGIFSYSNEQYRKASGVSNSDLKWLARSPLHFRAKMDGLIPDETSDALTLGAITHRACLEPETMAGAFAVKPDDMSFATKEGKAWRAEQGDKPIVSADAAASVRGMSAVVNAHPMAKRFLTDSDFERSLFADDDGLLLKSRFDILPRTGNAIADLKTCEDASLEAAEKAIGGYGYFRQAAFYLRVANLLGLKREAFVFIFVEKMPPYAVACYQLADEVARAGKMLIERDLTVLRECEASGKWPGYSDGVRGAGVPKWLMNQLENLGL
jgi:hypothetical protein